MSGMGSACLRLEGVFIALGERLLVPPLALTIAPGEVTTIMGPSGCGKSSLLAYICGTLDPAVRAGGRIWLNEVDLTALPPEQRRIGILFQDDLLFPHMSVAENLGFGLTSRIRDRAARRARIEAALAEAGLAGFAEQDPSTLSGGQRARVALLRTLLSEPLALLLDEPFGRLDTRLKIRFRRSVLDHARDRRLPTLLVTHDPADAEAAGGPVVEILPADNGAEAANQLTLAPQVRTKPSAP
jgi:putative thiamine transport system ATP-binding protein